MMDLSEFVALHDPDDLSVEKQKAELRRQFQAGEGIEEFLASESGTALLHEAAEDLAAARTEMEALGEKPLSAEEFKLQFDRCMFRIKVIKTAFRWMIESIKLGRRSIEIYKEYM